MEDDLFEAVVPPRAKPDASFVEGIEAGWTDEQINSNAWEHRQARMGDTFARISDALYGDPDAWKLAAGPTANRHLALNAMFRDLAARKTEDHQSFGMLPGSYDEVAAEVEAVLDRERADAQEVLGRSGVVGPFIGASARAMTGPANLFLAPFGGGASGLLRFMATEAALGAGAAFIENPARADMARRLGQPQPDLASDMLLEGALSAGFAGGLSVAQRGAAYLLARKSTENAVSPVDPATTQAAIDTAVSRASAHPSPDTPRGIRNNNPGNIERNGDNWRFMTGDDGRFLQFDSPEAGIRAMSRILDTYSDTYGLDTVEGIIARWAPPTENDTDAYVRAVAADLGVAPDTPLTPLHRMDLIKAIIRHENGRQPYDNDTIRRGIEMAGRQRDADSVLAPRDIVSLDPDDIEVDAATYQFKAGGDRDGVTDRLAAVKQWDALRAGVIVVHQRDGRTFVADGHQRVGLARRLKAGGEDVRVNAIVLGDDLSPEEVRALAAMRNIAEGTGTAIDAAKALRLNPEFIDTLPPQSALVRDAKGLVRLADPAFQAIVNDVVPPQYGAIVGNLTDDPAMQDALITTLARTRPANAQQAQSIARDALAAGRAADVEGAQGALFGGAAPSDTLYIDRAKVLDTAIRKLRKDRSVFSTLTREASRIENAGNTLDADSNSARAASDGQAIAIIERLASRAGPVSDSLTAAARRLREGDATAADGFVRDIRRALEGGDIARLLGDTGRGAPPPEGSNRPVSQEGDEPPPRVVQPEKLSPDEDPFTGSHNFWLSPSVPPFAREFIRSLADEFDFGDHRIAVFTTSNAPFIRTFFNARGMQVSVKRSVYGSAFPALLTKGRGTFVIINDQMQDVTRAKLLETIAHEIGHIIEMDMMRQGPVAARMRAAWKKRHQSRTMMDDIANIRGPFSGKNDIRRMRQEARKVGVDFDPATYRNFPYRSRFEEWAADQIARFLITDAPAQNVFDQFFRSIANMWRRIAAKLRARPEYVDSSIRDWFEAIRRRPDTEAPIDARPSGAITPPEAVESVEEGAMLDAMESAIRDDIGDGDLAVDLDGVRISARQMLADIEGDREFAEILGLCAPDGTLARKTA